MLSSLLWHWTFRELLLTLPQRIVWWSNRFSFYGDFLNFPDRGLCFCPLLYSLFLSLHLCRWYVYRSCWSLDLLDWLCNSTLYNYSLLRIYCTKRNFLSLILDWYCTMDLCIIAIREPRKHLVRSLSVIIFCLLVRDCSKKGWSLKEDKTLTKALFLDQVLQTQSWLVTFLEEATSSRSLLHQPDSQPYYHL